MGLKEPFHFLLLLFKVVLLKTYNIDFTIVIILSVQLLSVRCISVVRQIVRTFLSRKT